MGNSDQKLGKLGYMIPTAASLAIGPAAILTGLYITQLLIC